MKVDNTGAKTILYVHNIAGMGGASHSLMLMARRIRDHGWKPIVAGQQDHEGVWEQCEKAGIPYYPLYLSDWSRSGMTWHDLLYLPSKLNTIRKLVRICREEDVSLVHTNLQSCLEGAFAARIAGLPHIFHVREQINPTVRKYWGGVRGGVWTISSLSDRIIAISRDIRDSFVEHGRGDTACVIPNATEIPDLPTDYDSATIRQRWDLPKTAPLIGMFGNIASWKDQVGMVRAMKRLEGRSPAHLVVVGRGFDAGYVERVHAEVSSLGLTDRVHFIDHLPDIWPLMRAMDVLACPSLSEGFGRVLIEGMGAGVPVIGTDVGGIPDIIQDHENGMLVPPADPDSLADGLLELMENADLRRKLIEAGKQTVAQRYTPEIHVERIAGVYEELLRDR